MVQGPVRMSLFLLFETVLLTTQDAYGIFTYCPGKEGEIWGRLNCRYVENQGTGSSYCALHKLFNFELTKFGQSPGRCAHTHMAINTTPSKMLMMLARFSLSYLKKKYKPMTCSLRHKTDKRIGWHRLEATLIFHFSLTSRTPSVSFAQIC